MTQEPEKRTGLPLYQSTKDKLEIIKQQCEKELGFSLSWPQFCAYLADKLEEQINTKKET